MEIKPNRITHTYVEHFDPQGNSLGELNELENLDLRTQIVKAQAEGYYMIFEGKRIDLTTDGDLTAFPRGMYDLIQQQLAELFRATQEVKKNKN